jgi:hypothetical protein
MAPYHRPRRDGRRASLVETELTMPETENAADEVLAHSEDEGEWEDGPEQIESRPSGTQVISARLPTGLAEELLTEASRRKVRPSELVRAAVDAYLHDAPGAVIDLLARGSANVTISLPRRDGSTENLNLVVDSDLDTDRLEIPA